MNSSAAGKSRDEREKIMARTMSLQDACELVDDDLPDGAYWAIVHDIAGAEYGDAWDELDSSPVHKQKHSPKQFNKVQCRICKRWMNGEQGLAAHHKAKH
jgi:hypothetical protein